MHSSRTVIQDLYLLRPCLLSNRVCLKLNVHCSMWHGQFIISFEQRTDEYTFNLVHSLSSFIMPPHHPSSPPFDLYKKTHFHKFNAINHEAGSFSINGPQPLFHYSFDELAQCVWRRCDYKHCSPSMNVCHSTSLLLFLKWLCVQSACAAASL